MLRMPTGEARLVIDANRCPNYSEAAKFRQIGDDAAERDGCADYAAATIIQRSHPTD
jgi:hypothetical protein